MSTVLEAPAPIYQMPKCKPGMEVLFYPDCAESEPGHLAWITKVGEKAVEVLVLGPAMRQLRYVKHVSDPQRLTTNFRHNGSWDYRPGTFEIETLKKRVDELTAQVAELAEIVTGGRKGK